MPKYSAPDAFQPAIQRTKALLFKPFRFGFWCRLALIGLLTGELSSSSCSLNGNVPTNIFDKQRQQQFVPDATWHRLAEHFWIIVGIAALFFLVAIVFMYIAARCRFMLFEAIVDGDVCLRDSWRKWKDAATSFFSFLLTYTVAIWGALAVFVGTPLFVAYAIGFTAHWREHLAIAALGITLLVMIALSIVFTGTVFFVAAKDFAVPIMALEGISVGAALRKLGRIVDQQKGSFAGYMGMKFVLTLGAGLASGIASFIVIMIVLIPVALVAVMAVLIGASAGLTWTPATIALAVALGVNALIGIMIIVMFGHTPLAAFFPSYSLLYFAGRYQPLHDRLFPPPAPPIASVPEPPPGAGPDLPPEPAIG